MPVRMPDAFDHLPVVFRALLSPTEGASLGRFFIWGPGCALGPGPCYFFSNVDF
jgi:hypothetical protein